MKVTVVKPFFGIEEKKEFTEGETVDMTEARFKEVSGKLPGYVKKKPTRSKTRTAKPTVAEG